MVKFSFTRLGKIFVALMLLFYGAAVTSQSGLLLLLIGLIGGCFAVNWSFARRNVCNVRIDPPKDITSVEGSPFTQPWTLTNGSSKHIEMIEAFADDNFLFRIPLVEVGEVVSVLPSITYKNRGVYPHARITIKSGAPFGLLYARRVLDLPGEVVVYPRVYQTSSPVGVGLDFIAGGRFRGMRRVNSGAHFAGVRSWQPGDTLKQVHWNSTARRGELMVKSFEEELGGRVSLILDCEPGEKEAVNNAVRAAASLGVATLQEGHQLEYVDASRPETLRLLPFADEREFLDRLARYEPTVTAPPFDLERMSRKSVLAIVGTRFRAEWLHLVQQAERQNRSVHIFVQQKIALPQMAAELWQHSNDEIVPWVDSTVCT